MKTALVLALVAGSAAAFAPPVPPSPDEDFRLLVSSYQESRDVFSEATRSAMRGERDTSTALFAKAKKLEQDSAARAEKVIEVSTAELKRIPDRLAPKVQFRAIKLEYAIQAASMVSFRFRNEALLWSAAYADPKPADDAAWSEASVKASLGYESQFDWLVKAWQACP
jgi:hypothetical protein